MKAISNKQEKAIEKITGRFAESFTTESLESYFAFTDRGFETDLFKRVWHLQLPGNQFSRAEQDLWDLMQAHTFHPVIIELWRNDFKNGLLFMSDFIGCPQNYIDHARQIKG